MKILIVHNDYGKYSGEEAVVDTMIADGRRAGFEIETLRRTSKDARDTFWGQVHGFFSGMFSISGRRMMRQALRTFQPDIVHIHNLYPFISPSVLPLCKRYGAPVVMTVHNYRLICPTGLFLRDGKPCENCLHNGNEKDCVRYNCEGSLFRSIGYAMRNAVARISKVYLNDVEYYCCLTQFQKQKLIEAGFDERKIKVFGNYTKYVIPEEPNEETEKWSVGYIGYVGRLSYEKGFDMLIEVARRHPEIEFRLAGEIRDGNNIQLPQNIQMCGYLTNERLARFYCNSSFIMIPSRCYEGFPMVLLESSSHQRCCIAPNHGAFPDIMTEKESGEVSGVLFNPLDVDDLERKTVELWSNKNESVRLGLLAEKNYKDRFIKAKSNQQWDYFLKEIIAKKKNR